MLLEVGGDQREERIFGERIRLARPALYRKAGGIANSMHSAVGPQYRLPDNKELLEQATLFALPGAFQESTLNSRLIIPGG